MNNYAIILASGSGERAGLNIPKQFAIIRGKTILEYTIEKFEAHEQIAGIIVVSNPKYIDKVQKILMNNNYYKVLEVLPGGKTRQQSSYIGISAIKDINSNVLIHDAVRPFISNEIISNCIEALKKYKAVNVVIESSDTIIEVDKNNIIKNTLDRKFLRRCQTPQGFRLNIIKKAHELSIKDNQMSNTDDCSLVLKYNLTDIFVVNGSNNNIKITYPIDIEIANLIYEKQKKENT